MSIKENKAIVIRFLKEIWENGEIDVVDEIVAKDHVHHLSRSDRHGPDGVKQLVTWFRVFLPDLQIVINDLIAEEDKVMAYITFSGTDQGGYFDNPPSGNPVKYTGIDIFRLADGKIVERWGIVDTITMMHQVGAIN